MIAITSAIFLFIIPSKNNKKSLLEWNEAVKIPWGILILFGGGFLSQMDFKQLKWIYGLGINLAPLPLPMR